MFHANKHRQPKGRPRVDKSVDARLFPATDVLKPTFAVLQKLRGTERTGQNGSAENISRTGKFQRKNGSFGERPSPTLIALADMEAVLTPVTGIVLCSTRTSAVDMVTELSRRRHTVLMRLRTREQNRAHAMHRASRSDRFKNVNASRKTSSVLLYVLEALNFTTSKRKHNSAGGESEKIIRQKNTRSRKRSAVSHSC